MNEPTKERAAALERIEYFLKAWECAGVSHTIMTVEDSPDTHAALTVEDLRALLAAAPVSERAAHGEPVAYRYRHSDQEKWHYGETPQNWWECQALSVAAPSSTDSTPLSPDGRIIDKAMVKRLAIQHGLIPSSGEERAVDGDLMRAAAEMVLKQSLSAISVNGHVIDREQIAARLRLGAGFSKEWCMKMAALEGDHDFTVGGGAEAGKREAFLNEAEIEVCGMEPSILRLLANEHEHIASGAHALDEEVRAAYHDTRASELNARADAEEREMIERGDIASAQQSDAAKPLTDTEIEEGWQATFSTNNPYCPCNLKSFTKAVRWAERAAKRRKS